MDTYNYGKTALYTTTETVSIWQYMHYSILDFIKRFRSWRWARRNAHLGRGTRLAMEYGNKHAKPPTPALVAAVRKAMEHERRAKSRA